jgi:type VI protein secretion system component Hcp
LTTHHETGTFVITGGAGIYSGITGSCTTRQSADPVGEGTASTPSRSVTRGASGMAIEFYVYLVTQNGAVLPGESQIVSPPQDPFKRAEVGAHAIPTQLVSYSFDIEQTLNIGSQSAGAGAGKVTYNPLTITKRVDVNSPTLFSMCCSGTPFKYLDLLLVDNTGTPSTTLVPFAAYGLGLVAVKTISHAGGGGDNTNIETVSFEFGQLSIGYAKQLSTGALDPFHYTTWDRVNNVSGPSA